MRAMPTVDSRYATSCLREEAAYHNSCNQYGRTIRLKKARAIVFSHTQRKTSICNLQYDANIRTHFHKKRHHPILHWKFKPSVQCHQSSSKQEHKSILLI